MSEGFEIQCVPGMGLPDFADAQASGTAHPEEWFFEALGGVASDAGVRVNPKTALSHGPVWQAVNILAGDVGQLPFRVYRRQERKREKYIQHPVDWLLDGEPNETQTPSVWKETMMAWALLWGNACCYVERTGGRPSALIPLLPDRTRPREVEWRDDAGTRHSFMVIETDVDGKTIPLLYDDVYHIPGLTTDGFWGVSAISAAKNVIGHGLALEKHGNKLFSNGARPSGTLEHQGKLSTEARDNLRREWYAIHGGVDNAAKIAILMEGMKFNPMSMSNDDAQWMEDRRFDREQVASLFNLPAYKLNALENSAVRSNLEQQNRDYLNTSLARWLNKFREEGERKLFTYNERRSRKVYLRWIVEAFLRGDLAARGAYYSQAKSGEWMTTNEIRELEDMNPIEGGDELRNPAINPQEPAPKPSDPPPEPDDGRPAQEQSRTIARRLVRSQVGALLETEAKSLEKAAGPGGARNFCKWAANYYEGYAKMAANFVELPGEVASQAGLSGDWRSAVELHARDSLQAVLGLTELVTKDGLQETIAERAEAVRAMGDELSSSILGSK